MGSIRIVTTLLFAAASGFPQSWLDQNYRFVSPPPAGEAQAASTVAQLEEIQNTVLSILRKADFARDFEAALAAAAQAAANAQLIGSIKGELKLKSGADDRSLSSARLIAAKARPTKSVRSAPLSAGK